jgi:Lon protease-like protein
MKNALVLHQHLGDDGAVSEGMILRDITSKRFDILEKAGLIRQATDAEMKEGYKLPFVAEADEESDVVDHVSLAIDAARREVAEQAQSHIDQLKSAHADALRVESGKSAALAEQLASANARAQAAEDRLKSATAELEAANAAITEMSKKAAGSDGGEKQAEKPANKKAADPANKEA